MCAPSKTYDGEHWMAKMPPLVFTSKGRTPPAKQFAARAPSLRSASVVREIVSS